MALQFERTASWVFCGYRITSGQLTVLIISETGLMGLVAGLLAIPVGFIVAYVLILLFTNGHSAGRWHFILIQSFFIKVWL